MTSSPSAPAMAEAGRPVALTSGGVVDASSPWPQVTLDDCREMQQDELLALEAIYEQTFSHWRDLQGRLVFRIRIEVDLLEPKHVIVEEKAVPGTSMRRKADPSSHASKVHPSRGGRGRGGRGSRSGVAKRGAFQQQASNNAATAVCHRGPPAMPPSNGLDLQELECALPESPLPLPSKQTHDLQLQYLLPLELTATLSSAYPLEESPDLRLDSPWLYRGLREGLLARIRPLWQNDVAIFMMVDELIQAFQSDALPQPTVFRDEYRYHGPESLERNSLQSRLVTHDRLMRNSIFSSESFDCGICLETKKGARCTRLRSCGHVFCVECLHSFFELNIREGMAKNVCCADMECVKGRNKANDRRGEVDLDEVEAIVGKELLDRYTWLLEKQETESDPTITYCPRDVCNAPVPREKEEDYERLRICPKCGYSFCVYCRRTYHGTKSRCVFSQAASIVDKYINGDTVEKKALEARYGKTNVQKMVEMWQEEQANAQWIKDNSTACPNCQLNIERSMGCAHMTCGRCQCHFCFRCGARLNAKDPYAHFSTPGLSCYNRLFDHQPSTEQEWIVDDAFDFE